MFRSEPQQTGDLGEKLFAFLAAEDRGWVCRKLSDDFGMDFELELADPEVAGHLLRVQVKTSSAVIAREGRLGLQVSTALLRYAQSCRYPVILVLVHPGYQNAWFLWLQEWLMHQNVRAADLVKQSVHIEIPYQNSFGNPTVSVSGQPFRYTGREWDSEIGQYYYRTRYYDSSPGRFLTEDPMAFGAGVNFYRYVSNSSPNRADPFGLEDLGKAGTKNSDYVPWPTTFNPAKQDIVVNWPPRVNGVDGIAYELQRKHFPGHPDPYGGGYRHSWQPASSRRTLDFLEI